MLRFRSVRGRRLPAAAALASVLGCAGGAGRSGAPETFGAGPDALGPPGGGSGYARLVEKGDFHVRTEDELADALAKAKPGQVVYVDDAAELDFTVRVRAQKLVLEIPGGVTLAGGRGRGGSPGALITSDEFATHPLFKTTGANVRVTGLRLRGPDPKMRWDELPRLHKLGGQELYYAFPVSAGVQVAHDGCEIDNCEISAWTMGVEFHGEGGRRLHVHHNDIHHCCRRGLGYGVAVDQGECLIESNRFDFCRHAINGSGAPGTRYEARNNIVEARGILHSFDMHGGKDRGDGTSIAGEWIRVHHNTFLGLWQGAHPVLAVAIRGTPTGGGEVHHNRFIGPDPGRVVFQHGDKTVRVYRNQYGPEGAVKD